jgi:hypothetical protein
LGSLQAVKKSADTPSVSQPNLRENRDQAKAAIENSTHGEKMEERPTPEKTTSGASGVDPLTNRAVTAPMA